MDKYKKLLSNTIVFAIGTFASKALVFLLMPLYTRVLTNEQYGSADLIVQTANLLIPFVSVGMFNAVIRFGLGKNSDRRGVFSICIVSIMCGFMLLLAASPLLSNIQGISGYTSLICAYVLCSCLHSICAQFIRARQMVRLFAIDGIFCTVLTILFNILFLVVFDMGVMGYVLATVLADIICAVSLFLVASLWKYFDLRSINKPLALSMLKYALPLIPTSVFWWITNVSDRYMVTYMVSLEAEGLYAAAYKIPTILTLLSNVFMEAWQLSSLAHGKKKGGSKFFHNVFGSLQSLVFIAGSALILTCKLITSILVSPDFYASWEYIPLLIMATACSCFTSFLGSVYMLEKKSVKSLLTTIAGAGSNVALNFILIPQWGVNGAAAATFISYLLVYILRGISAKKMMHFNLHSVRAGICLLIMLAQSVIMILEIKGWLIYELLLFAVIFVINIKNLLLSAQRLLKRKTRRSENSSALTEGRR
ncbi:MAG: oligosaccharide flippase family protein [Christensenellaceae bacterium]|jgi:hypothetical protein|nr:oligosaccharide flippase family protein [Christensenellaceae bacterium]MBS6564989.1 polysaccharide biosynthesis C-terminal domain-containing protein [Clostridiales bacterium]